MTIQPFIGFPRRPQTAANGNDAYTKILLHLDGANGSTTFTDSCAGASPHTFTASGNAQITTATSIFGGACAVLDGTGDYISTPDNADFTLGADPWTVDFQLHVAGGSGTQRWVFGHSGASGGNSDISIAAIVNTSNKLELWAFIGVTQYTVTSTTSFTPGFAHVELCRTGNTLKMFINGVQEGGDVSITGSINDSTGTFTLGRLGSYTGGNYLNGYIDEFRLSVGIARHTANFTPQASAYS